MFRNFLIAAALLVLAAAPSAPVQSADSGTATTGSSTEPKGLPIELKILADVSLCELDSRGDPPYKFQENIRKGEKSGILVPATRFEMELEIKNTGPSSIQIWVDGDATLLALDLKGNGAMTAEAKLPKPEGVILPSVVTLPPGKSHKIPLTKLEHGFRMQAKHSYIADLGRCYQLSASFRTAVYPAPKGSRILQGGFGEVLLKSAPIEFRAVRPS